MYDYIPTMFRVARDTRLPCPDPPKCLPLSHYTDASLLLVTHLLYITGLCASSLADTPADTPLLLLALVVYNLQVRFMTCTL